MHNCRDASDPAEFVCVGLQAAVLRQGIDGEGKWLLKMLFCGGTSRFSRLTALRRMQNTAHLAHGSHGSMGPQMRKRSASPISAARMSPMRKRPSLHPLLTYLTKPQHNAPRNYCHQQNCIRVNRLYTKTVASLRAKHGIRVNTRLDWQLAEWRATNLHTQACFVSHRRVACAGPIRRLRLAATVLLDIQQHLHDATLLPRKTPSIITKKLTNKQCTTTSYCPLAQDPYSWDLRTTVARYGI